MSYSTVAETERQGLEARSWWPWMVCLSTGLFFFYEFIQLHMLDVFNQPLRDTYHLGANTFSWISSTFVWANTLFLLPAGFILDRYPTRLILLLAFSICIIGTFGFALGNSAATFAFFRTLIGASNAFCFLSAALLVSRWFTSNRHALVMGIIVTMAMMGGVVAHTPMAYLIDLLGWRQALYANVALGVVLYVWVACVVRDKSSTDTSTSSNASRDITSPFLAALKNRQNWFGGLYTACLNLPLMVLCALWGASYLAEVYGLSAFSSSNVISFILLGSMFGSPAAGLVSDALGKRKAVMTGGAILSLITLIPLFMQVHLSTNVLSFLFFLLGFITSTQVITYPLVTESNNANNTGIALGITSTLIMGGAALAQVLFGVVLQVVAGSSELHYVASDFRAALWLFPIAFLLALFASLLVKEPRGLLSVEQDV